MAYDAIFRQRRNIYSVRVRYWPEGVNEEEARKDAVKHVEEQSSAHLSQPT